eukprot:scaffold33561_cov28-Tisochrysis_lutea.AAC.5
MHYAVFTCPIGRVALVPCACALDVSIYSWSTGHLRNYRKSFSDGARADRDRSPSFATPPA